MSDHNSIFDIEVNPKTVTVITTYTCNAACEECCFECNPTVKHRLSFEEIATFIKNSVAEYPSIEQFVFSGGECFLLKEDLYKAIALCASLGRSTRCVSNGYWGKTRHKAEKIAATVVEAGLAEVNFSTGLDHKKWVPIDSVITASECLAKYGIPVLITIEKDTEESDILNQITENERVRRLSHSFPNFSLQTNSWMPFHENSVHRGGVDRSTLRKGCDQVFTNCVLTPKKEIASCCGLTLEHIPEMRVGTIDNVASYRDEQKDDFMKLWLRVEGPMTILETLLGRDHEKLQDVVHLCQACAIVHRDHEVREKIASAYTDHILAVGHKWNIIKTAELEASK